MKLRPEQWAAHLQQNLLPIYLISSDETLLQQEALDALRQASRQQGFDDRLRIDVDKSFEPAQLLEECQSLSLFGDRKIIELRLPKTPDAELAKVLIKLCRAPSPEHRVILSLPLLNRRDQDAEWVKAIDSAGVMMLLPSMAGAAFAAWLKQRLQSQGMLPDDEVLQLLIERTEGNLLAAAQEVDKLRLLNGPGPLDRDTLRHSTADSARYDVYELAEAALSGQTHRALRMLDQRLEEGEAPSLILYPLVNDLRTLLQAQFMVQQGVAPAIALTRAGAWSSRQPTLQPALRRLGPRTLRSLMNLAHDIDRAIKGRSDHPPIDSLRRLIAALSGSPLFRSSAAVR